MNRSPDDPGCPLGLPASSALGNHGGTPEDIQMLTCGGLDLLPGDLIVKIQDNIGNGVPPIPVSVGPWLFIEGLVVAENYNIKILNESGKYLTWYNEKTDVYSILRRSE